MKVRAMQLDKPDFVGNKWNIHARPFRIILSKEHVSDPFDVKKLHVTVP